MFGSWQTLFQIWGESIETSIAEINAVCLTGYIHIFATGDARPRGFIVQLVSLVSSSIQNNAIKMWRWWLLDACGGRNLSVIVPVACINSVITYDFIAKLIAWHNRNMQTDGLYRSKYTGLHPDRRSADISSPFNDVISRISGLSKTIGAVVPKIHLE
jgi:hypothetical protein